MNLDDAIPWGSRSNPSSWSKRTPLLIMAIAGFVLSYIQACISYVFFKMFGNRFSETEQMLS
ncbi:MAG: hypothetical protein ABI237_07165 [Ginsengibacter sp.]